MNKHIASLAAAVVLIMSNAAFALDKPKESPIGYPSVAVALAAMRAKPGVQISVQDGWTIINDKATMTLWTFTPPGHPAHPTAARRQMRHEKDGSWTIQQGVLCQVVEKAPCDKINAEFIELNNKIREQLRQETLKQRR